MPDIRELGRLTKAKYPEYAGLSDEEVGRRVKARFPGAYDQFTDAPAQQPPQDDWLTRFRRNAGLAAEQGYTALKDKAAALGEAFSSRAAAAEFAEQIGRGAVRSFTTRLTRDPNTGAFLPNTSQDARLAELQAQQDARRLASGDTSFQQRAQRQAELEAQAQAYDPSRTGRITRGVVREGIKLGPTVVAGIASGGSLPVIAGVTAATSLDRPQELPGNVALSVAPLPPVGAALRAGREAIRRTLGRGVEQIIEAEARAAPRFAESMVQSRWPRQRSAPPMIMPDIPNPVQRAGELPGVFRGAAPEIRAAASPGATGQATQMSLPGFEKAVAEAAGEIPLPLARRIKNEIAAIYHIPRSLMASADLSAFRQGALLAVQPTNWTKAGRATVKMFQAFSPKQNQRIVDAIAADADAQLGQRFGLDLTSQAVGGLRRAEEGFISKYSGRIPIVAASERVFTVFLDTLRLSKFKQLRKIIDAQDFTQAQRESAYRRAADWINIASGRGSLGAKFESAMPILNATLFAPRYMASRIQVLNPMTYLKNAGTAEGRVILRHQMSELAQYAGVVAGVLATAKAAGADVSLNPLSSDFLKIRIGRYRYDPLSGLQQTMRLFYRTGAAITNAAQGEKVKPGEGALDIGGHFLRSKLGPVPSYFTDFALGRTYTGEKFSPVVGAAERVFPIMWSDWVDAYQDEGWRGVGMVTPGMIGVGVSAFDARPGGFLDKAQPLLTEYTRAGRQLPEIRRIKGEADQQFNARVKVFGEALSRYGAQLVESNEYRQADAAAKDRALILLPRRISSALMKQNESWQLQPRVLMSDVRENLELRRELERERR